MRDEGASELPWVLLFPFAVGSLVDLPRALHAGSVSALGALGVVQVAVAISGLLAARAYPRAVLWRFTPYGCFLGWMICRSTTAWPDQNGVQNAFAYVLFGAQFLLAGTLAATRPRTTVSMLRGGMLMFDTITLALVLVCFLAFGLPRERGEGPEWLIGPRAVGLLAIVPISWHLAAWCHGRRGSGIRVFAWILAVVASLSRTATAVALVSAAMAFVAQWWVTPARFVRKLPYVAAGAALLAVVILAYQSEFRQRFLEGYNNVEVAGVAISTSGRNRIWPVVIESAMRHPIIGSGLGSSQAALWDFDATVVGHPHNDYLRVWHDGGVIGLSFLLAALLWWLALLRRQWVQSIRMVRPDPEIDLAALLALVGIMLAALTDNGFVYTYVMAPAGLLIGTAFGVRVSAAVRQRSSRMRKLAVA